MPESTRPPHPAPEDKAAMDAHLLSVERRAEAAEAALADTREALQRIADLYVPQNAPQVEAGQGFVTFGGTSYGTLGQAASIARAALTPLEGAGTSVAAVQPAPSSGETQAPEPDEGRGPSGGSLPSAATPGPTGNPGPAAGSGAPLDQENT